MGQRSDFAIRSQFPLWPPWFSWRSTSCAAAKLRRTDCVPSLFTQHTLLSPRHDTLCLLLSCLVLQPSIAAGKAFFFIYICRSPYHRLIHDGQLSARVRTYRSRGIDQHTSLSLTKGSSERLLPPFRTPNRYCRSKALYRRRSP